MMEAFAIGIRLRLLDSVSSGLIGMAGQFAAFNKHVAGSQANLTALEGKLKSIKMMGFLGGITLGVGVAGLALFKAPIEEAKEWQQEAAKFSTLGFGAKVNSDAQQFARGMQTYGTSARDNLALLGDAMSVFKNLDHAEMAAPILAKMKFGNEAIFGEGGSANERQFMDMLKVVEMRRGLSSSQEFATQADFVQKAISGSRGRVNASQWLQLLKTGGVAVSQMQNQDFYLGLEPLLQEFGGQRLGTGLMSIYSNLIQARSTQTAQREMYRLGLLDKSKVEFNEMGQLKKALPGSFLHADVFEKEGILPFLEKVLLPAFSAHGITTEPQIIDELARILSNRTGSSLSSRAFQQRASIEMQADANRNAMGINALNTAAQQTPEGKMIELTKQYKNLLLELGTAVLPIAIKMVTGLTAVIRGAVAFAREFPMLTHALEISFGVLSGIVAVGGALTLATAGFKALGLALTLGGGAGSLGGLLRVVTLGLGGPLGLIAGIAALGIAVAGSAWLLNKMLPKKDDGQDHPGEHWVPGQGRSGAGGSWEDDTRWVGPARSRHEEFWDPASSSWAMSKPGQPAATPQISPYIAAPKSQPITITTNLNVDGKKVATAVNKVNSKALSVPQTGPSSFDGSLMPTPAGAAGF